jgi:hypothetical protein
MKLYNLIILKNMVKIFYVKILQKTFEKIHYLGTLIDIKLWFKL